MRSPNPASEAHDPQGTKGTVDGYESRMSSHVPASTDPSASITHIL